MLVKDTVPGMLIITFFCIMTAVLLVPVSVHAASTQPDILSPLKQMQQGVAVADILCGDEKILMNSTNGRIACVYPDTAERLVLHGWEVLPQSKQNLEEDVPESGIDILDQELPGVAELAVEIEIPQAPSALEHLSANASTTQVYEPIYYVADNKITLSGVEKKMPLSSGILLPATKEDVENIIMPRIASGVGDTLILPAANMSSYGYTMYETEMGNKFRIQSNEEYLKSYARYSTMYTGTSDTQSTKSSLHLLWRMPDFPTIV